MQVCRRLTRSIVPSLFSFHLSAAVACLLLAVDAHAQTKASAPAPVKAAPAAPVAAVKSNNDTIRVLIAAEQESVLASQMAGRIEEVDVSLGEKIKKGEGLIRFVCEEQDAHLKMAKAEFAGAQQTYESKIKLQALQSVAEVEVQQAAANAEKFKAQIQLYKAQLKLCNIAAPYSGRVTKIHVKPFESVTAGQPLLDIVNDRKLKAQLHLPSNWLAWVKPGVGFTMQIDETGKTYEAKIARINGKVDAVSQSIEVEGEVVGNVEGLLPGMSGQATFKK